MPPFVSMGAMACPAAEVRMRLHVHGFLNQKWMQYHPVKVHTFVDLLAAMFFWCPNYYFVIFIIQY